MRSTVSHTGSAYLTGATVEMTCTVDMKQQHSSSSWYEAGKAPEVSLPQTDPIKILQGGGANTLANWFCLDNGRVIIASGREVGSYVSVLKENMQHCLHVAHISAASPQTKTQVLCSVLFPLRLARFVFMFHSWFFPRQHCFLLFDLWIKPNK